MIECIKSHIISKVLSIWHYVLTCLFAVLLLLAVAVTTCGRHHHIKKGTGLLVGDSEDDIRDNVLNYDEQGGGEEDEVRLHDL